MTYHYLMDLALILLSTKVLGILTKRIQMPQVVGALVAGLILGPAMLNVLSETEFLTQLSELGVIVLMFSAGMGTDIQELKHSGKAGFLVALLILSPEGLGALKAVLNNQVQRAMNLFFGSVLATISLTVPVVTLIAWATGNDLVFALGAPEMIVMVSSLVLCHISFSTGRTNVLNGAAHLALFIAYLMTIFA